MSMFPRPGAAWLAYPPQNRTDRHPPQPRRPLATQPIPDPLQPTMLLRLAVVAAAGALLVTVVMSASV
jgi:hypothetical protein